MEEESSDSQSLIIIPESKIRVIESNIQAQLESFEKEVSETTFLETSNVCDNVRDQILNYDDEPHLSKTQNNWRRIYIASDLFISICSVYGHIVDNEFTNIINSMVQWEKYNKISRKITRKMHLQTKKEKHFAKEAKSKLLKSVEDAGGKTVEEKETEVEESAKEPLVESEPRVREVLEQMTTPMEVTEEVLPVEEREIGTALARITERESSLVDLRPAEATPDFDISGTWAPPLESTTRDDILHANLTQMRAEPVTDASLLQHPVPSIPRQDLSVPDTLAETSIREPVAQEKIDDELQSILQILEGEGFQDVLQPIEHPEGSAEVQEDAVVEEIQTDADKRMEESENSEEWSLPTLDTADKARKKTRLIIDDVTVIPDYAGRALHLNRNIKIQRIQVFEGPPNILQGISVNHLMRTPGFKSSLFHDVRSSRLGALFSRHLELEKRPVETVLQRREIERRREDVSTARRTVDIIEEVGERVGMRSLYEKTDLLAELPPDKSRQEDIEIPLAPPKESLIGMPMSRIITTAIEPPEEIQLERINVAPILPTPRVQQLQGKSLDPKPTSSWFISSKQSPPSGKYREFNYIYKKLQQYWALFEIQGMEKNITLREFFSFEEDSSLCNYLTALRIVDKLSIQRKVLVEFKNNDVIIKPFESPYVSDGQLLVKEMEMIL